MIDDFYSVLFRRLLWTRERLVNIHFQKNGFAKRTDVIRVIAIPGDFIGLSVF